MYDGVLKSKQEKQKIATSRTMQRLDNRINYMNGLVQLMMSKFNKVVAEK